MLARSTVTNPKLHDLHVLSQLLPQVLCGVPRPLFIMNLHWPRVPAAAYISTNRAAATPLVEDEKQACSCTYVRTHVHMLRAFLPPNFQKSCRKQLRTNSSDATWVQKVPSSSRLYPENCMFYSQQKVRCPERRSGVNPPILMYELVWLDWVSK